MYLDKRQDVYITFFGKWEFISFEFVVECLIMLFGDSGDFTITFSNEN